MPDRKKVIKGFTVCSEHGLLNGEDCHGHYEYTDNLADIIKANDYSKQCPYNGCKTGCVKTLAKDVLALLKEQEEEIENLKQTCQSMMEGVCLLKKQEAKYPVCEKCGKEIEHINTSVFNYDGSDSDYSIPITYSKGNGCVSFSTSQNWTGYDLTDEERKERIRCPYCGKFPFDDSIEIEFYEPVEVMMWTSEGR